MLALRLDDSSHVGRSLRISDSSCILSPYSPGNLTFFYFVETEAGFWFTLGSADKTDHFDVVPI
jgi:hypothetical protein